MNMNEKISVVIPIYKVEKYLKKCIDSIINQTYSNLEIILVDDGSPDKCPQICDEYSQKDSRIKVIHKKNGGLSDARNYGIKVSTGRWITFIDSDDYVSNDYIEYLYKLLKENKSDISIVLPYEFSNYEKINIKNEREIINVYDSRQGLIIMLYQKKFDTSAWGKLYKKELFNDIEFPCGKLYEDISTIYKAILKSDKIVYSNQKKYYYLKRNDSIMGQTFNVKDMDYVYQAEDMYDNIQKLKDEELISAAKCRVLNANFSILLRAKKTKSKKYIDLIRKSIKKNTSEVLYNKNCRLKTKIAIILVYLGVM